MEQFVARTDEAYTIKSIAEVLQNLFTDAPFELTETGIHLEAIDNKQPFTLLAVLDLYRDRFEEYKFTELFTIGITLPHLYKMLKSIKKKDKMSLVLSKEKLNHLGLCNLSGSHPVYSWVKVQKMQKLQISIPHGYGYPNLIPTADFQKMCKDMNTISKVIKVYSKGTYLCFSCEVENMYTRDVPFGELDPDSQEEEYEETFLTKSFSQLIKISGLSNKMQIYTKTGLPLRIKVDTGKLGKLDIYLKPREV